MEHLNNVKVSIIIPNLNGVAYLKKTLPHLLGINLTSCDVVVIDNGSVDGSVEYVKSIKDIKLVISPVKYSKNFACNFAISKSKGKYILLLDNDILIHDIEIIDNLIKYHSELDSVGSITLGYIDENEVLSKGYGGFFGYYFSNENRYLSSDKIIELDKSKVGCPAGIGIFIKKATWEMVGGYDDYLMFGGDDNDLGIKLILSGLNNYLYSRTLQTHIGNVNKKKSNKDYRLRWKLLVCSYLYTMYKNYKFINLVIGVVCFTTFAFIKSVKQSIFRLSFSPLLSFFVGYYNFLNILPTAIKKRKIIQRSRVIKKDIFLQIRPNIN